LHNVTLALQHYSGGCPVPRAESYYNGGLCTYANTYTNVGFFSPLFTYTQFYSNNQTAGFKLSWSC